MSKWVAALLFGAGVSLTAWADGKFDAQGFAEEMAQEAKVKDLLLTDTGNIYVGMLDNGSNRDGYAMYVCEVARAHASGELDPKIIRIIDIVKVSNGEGFHDLGRTYCKF
ncbi:hypothetical protein MHM84_03795 [Halomonas sp. McH1-25]|uniref:hypothetical protein n=1 Tax=unclassified Halomonas TaxID=2609666 RepID=UPI001EF409FA|nr:MULTISPECIES: hypothetical protein [unclassified Halomonas]MCG7598896.1 hypothetical protein [Halomonas sp. McH1-25]MCP1340859.1 hypothetical protein [Halomonas sp. FL8]MCP1361258.1 hypothetical protein [Halomonas sp. BBD45]MCP1363762.1 hypothetical protein [Halomonas sp. BBD48]